MRLPVNIILQYISRRYSTIQYYIYDIRFDSIIHIYAAFSSSVCIDLKLQQHNRADRAQGTWLIGIEIEIEITMTEGDFEVRII